MTTVRDMIRRKGSEIYTIAPDASVLEALRRMAKFNSGALLVMSSAKVAGILSERDCVRKVELAGKTPKDTTVGEIMTSEVISVEASQSLEGCMTLMLEKSIRHLPVYDGGELVGFISIRDVLKEVVDIQKSMIFELEHYITGGGR